MKRSLALAVVLASGFVLNASAHVPSAPLTSGAPAPAKPAGPTKIAVIAFQVAVAQTNEGQRNFADLERKYDPKRQQLKTLSDEVDNLTKQLQAQANTLSDAERASRGKTIDDKKKQLQRDAEDDQNDFNGEMQELYNTLASKVGDVMIAYAEERGYTLVLDIAQQQSPVLYATDSTNITKAVIDAYNVKSGVPAPPAQTGSEAPSSNLPSAPAPKRPATSAPKPPAAH